MDDGGGLPVAAQDPGRLDDHLQLLVPRERPDVIDDALQIIASQILNPIKISEQNLSLHWH